MLNDKQSENLLYNLSSFYQDFLPIDNQLIKLFNIYAKTINYVWDVYREVNDSRFVSSTRTLSTIPYFKVNIDNALYDLNTARVLERLSFEDQIAYLDKESKYASFVFEQKDAAGEPTVYGMRLFVNFTDTQPLMLYADYFVRSNRLYLLPNYIQTRKQTVHYLHAFDIKVNENTLEKNFGTRFALQAGPLLPRYEYRDVLEAYVRAFQGEMTIKAIKDSIRLATKWDKFSVEDYKSPHISPGKLRLYEDWVLSPFRFIVSLPESLIPDKVKVNIVRSFLNEIKEAQYDYMVFFDIDRPEQYRVPMKRIPTIHYGTRETGFIGETIEIPKIKLHVVDYPLDLYGRYDAQYYYNRNLDYDDPVVILDGEETSALDFVTITHYPLVIPRNFRGVRTVNSITFQCSSNTDTTTEFELYGSTSLTGPFTLLETVVNDSSSATISFQHNAIGSGNRYYKSRSKDPDETSLYTLTIDANAL